MDVPSESIDRPAGIYDLLTTNCKFKGRIQDLLDKMRVINKQRHELDEKFAPLKKDLSKVQIAVPKKYKAVKGDAIDEMFAQALNRH